MISEIDGVHKHIAKINVHFVYTLANIIIVDFFVHLLYSLVNLTKDYCTYMYILFTLKMCGHIRLLFYCHCPKLIYYVKIKSRLGPLVYDSHRLP